MSKEEVIQRIQERIFDLRNAQQDNYNPVTRANNQKEIVYLYGVIDKINKGDQMTYMKFRTAMGG